MSKVHTDVNRRHDFVLMVDVQNGNINGDPDSGNSPRCDEETGHGLITDVAIKRRVRNYIDNMNEVLPSAIPDWQVGRGGIYIRNDDYLNNKHQRAYTAAGVKSNGSKQSVSDINGPRRWMLDNYFDIRLFGAVMTTGVNCGQVQGPVQFSFGRTVDPISVQEHCITRCAVTTEGEFNKGNQGTMARKTVVSYGLYVAHGFFNPVYATRNMVTEADLAAFWTALEWSWETQRTTSRGEVSIRGLYIFSHDSQLGNAHAHDLFSRIQVNRQPGVEYPRSFGDYSVVVDDAPQAGITLTSLVGQPAVRLVA